MSGLPYDGNQNRGIRRTYNQADGSIYPISKRIKTVNANVSTEGPPWSNELARPAQFQYATQPQSTGWQVPRVQSRIPRPLPPPIPTAQSAWQFYSPSPSPPNSSVFCSPPSSTQAGLQPVTITIPTQTSPGTYQYYLAPRRMKFRTVTDLKSSFVTLPKLELDKRISTAKTLSEARRRFTEVDTYYKADAYSFSRMMKRCITSKRCELAYEYFEEMKTKNITANIVVYNVIIDACKENGEYERAKGYFDHMFQAGVIPNDRTYNSMMNVCVKNGLLKEGKELLKKMEEQFLKPNHRTFTSLINICVKQGLLQEAMNMKNEMLKRQVRPDNRTYTSLINVCVRDGQLKEAVKIKDEMKEQAKICTDCKVDDRLYNSLINVCVKDGLVREALEFKADMFEQGIPWDELTFTSLISCCIKDGRIEDATAFKTEMLQCNIRPNARTFTAMINVCVKDGRYEQACALRDEMVTRTVWPNERTYNALINVCVKDGLFKQASDLANEMLTKGMRLGVQVHNSLINVCVKEGKFAEASKILSSMAQYNLVPDNQTHEYFLTVMASAGMLERCKVYINEHADIFQINEIEPQVFDNGSHEAGFAFTLLLRYLPKGPTKIIFRENRRASRGLSSTPVVKELITKHLPRYQMIWTHETTHRPVLLVEKSKTTTSTEFSKIES